MKLRDYQELGVSFLRDRNRAGLFMDMGLGKTATTLMALEPRHLPAIVIAPKRVAETVWPEEARIWRRDLKLVLAAGSPAQRAKALRSGADITVLGRDNLKDLLGLPAPKTVIIDELSGFKTRASQRWKIARRATDKAEYVWGLTGTPSPNGYLDLWAQMYLLDKGERLGTTLTGYRGRYFMPGRQLPSGIITEWLLRPEAEEAIKRKIEDICLSFDTDGRVELPPTTYNEVVVPLSTATRRVYKKLKDTLVVDLESLGLMGEVHTADTAASLSNRLSQISAGFLYPDERGLAEYGDYDVIHTDKVMALREIVEGTGSPVLVFYRYAAECDMIMKELGKLGVRMVNQDGAIQAWNRGEVPVMLAHPASAGHGLNLQHGGHTIVWTSLPWSLEEWQQSNKRLSRSGQKNPVVIHMLMSPKTVDYAIKQALTTKTSVQKALLDHLESPL